MQSDNLDTGNTKTERDTYERDTPFTIAEQHKQEATTDETPWGMWTTAQKRKTRISVSQSFLITTMSDNRSHYVDKIMQERPHDNFERKAWWM